MCEWIQNTSTLKVMVTE
jgi:phosphatidylinositol kinase/protein kinase (PI-3  family)